MQTVLHFRGDEESSLEWLGRSIQVLRLLARRDPRNLWIGRSRLAVALAERGESRMRLGRLAEALADFEEVIELTHGTKDEELFRDLSVLTKARLGDLSALALLGDQVRDMMRAESGRGGASNTLHIMLCYDAACVHAALGESGRSRTSGKPPARKRQSARRSGPGACPGPAGQGAVGRRIQGDDPPRRGAEGNGCSRPAAVPHPRFQLP